MKKNFKIGENVFMTAGNNVMEARVERPQYGRYVVAYKGSGYEAEGRICVSGTRLFHEAIIDKAIFDRVQEELKRRAEQYETASSVVNEHNPLAQKLTCGLCGKHFIRKFANSKSKYKAPIWICQTYLARTKAACPSRRISEKVLFPILAGILGVPDEDAPGECERIQEIVVYPEGKLLIQMENETVERHWENPSRALSWTDEMKAEAVRKERERQECLKQR